MGSLSEENKLPERFQDDVLDSNWVLYVSWNYDENMPSFQAVSNTPPKGQAVGEDDFMFTIRVSEMVKEQIDKFQVVMDEVGRPYLALKDGEEFIYPSALDKKMADLRAELAALEQQKVSRDGKLR